MSTVTLESVLAQVEQLSPEDRLRLLDVLAAKVKKDQHSESDYHAFLDRLHGVPADETIERYPQGEYEERESLE